MIREEKEHICGNCKYHVFEDVDQGWVCVNSDSDCCASWTEFCDSCPDYEERD